MSFFSRMTRLFGRRVVLAALMLHSNSVLGKCLSLRTPLLDLLDTRLAGHYIISKIAANACPTEAAAVHTVEEVQYRINVELVLADLLVFRNVSSVMIEKENGRV